MSPMYKVLVADQIALDGLAPLRDDARFELIVKPGLKGNDLADAIASADAVLVRSATQITRESLGARAMVLMKPVPRERSAEMGSQEPGAPSDVVRNSR